MFPTYMSNVSAALLSSVYGKKPVCCASLCNAKCCSWFGTTPQYAHMHGELCMVHSCTGRAAEDCRLHARGNLALTSNSDNTTYMDSNTDICKHDSKLQRLQLSQWH